jgi:hypothetical protein
MIKELLWWPEWRSLGVPISRRAKPYRAPTWSWASVDFPDEPLIRYLSTGRSSHISYGFGWWRYGESFVEERFTLLEATCQVNGANPFGCVVYGHILAREAVIATTLQYKDGDERRIDLKNLQQYPFGLSIPGSTNYYFFYFAIKETTISLKAVLFLLFSSPLEGLFLELIMLIYLWLRSENRVNSSG